LKRLSARSVSDDGKRCERRGSEQVAAFGAEARTIEEQYHIDLGVRGDKQLKNILRDERVESLNDLIQKKRGQ
jgi:hypothetical protein